MVILKSAVVVNLFSKKTVHIRPTGRKCFESCRIVELILIISN